MPSYMNRTQVCRLIRNAVLVKWDYIDSVRRLKKRGPRGRPKGGKGRVKTRHSTRLKWTLYTRLYPDEEVRQKHQELRKVLVSTAQRLGLKYYDTLDEEGIWWGRVVIYIPNRITRPRLPITDAELRSHFGFIPDAPMWMVCDKMQEEGYEEEAIVIRSQLALSQA